MTVENFLILLALFSVLTSLVTEAVKKLFDSIGVTYVSNVVVLCVAAVVGGYGTSVFYMLTGCDWSLVNITCIFLMIFANWIGAMVGYDKVVQAITQFKGK